MKWWPVGTVSKPGCQCRVLNTQFGGLLKRTSRVKVIQTIVRILNAINWSFWWCFDEDKKRGIHRLINFGWWQILLDLTNLTNLTNRPNQNLKLCSYHFLYWRCLRSGFILHVLVWLQKRLQYRSSAKTTRFPKISLRRALNNWIIEGWPKNSFESNPLNFKV